MKKQHFGCLKSNFSFYFTETMMQRNISLDFFRGAMAIWVALGHFLFWTQHAYMMSVSFILAVDFFLVLSGFVIAASVLKKNEFDTYKFIQNRYFRLIPVYFFCVFITLTQQYIMHSENFTKPIGLDILRIIFLGEMLPFGNLRFNYFEPLGISYTISAEFWIGIILFPIVFTLKKYLINLLIPFLLITILFPLLKITNYTNTIGEHYSLVYPFLPFGLIRCLMEYSIGIGAYLIYERQTSAISNQQSAISNQQL